MLESHVALGLQPDASAEDIDEASALLRQGVDDGGAGRRKRGLEHETQDAQDAVEALPAGAVNGGVVPDHPLDAGHDLCDEDEVDDEGRGEEAVLADVGDGDGLVAAEEDLAVVLVHGALVVADGGHVLDHDAVVRVLLLLLGAAAAVQHVVGGDHVVDDVGLADLLGAELLLAREVLARRCCRGGCSSRSR